MNALLLVAAGGAIGAGARYGLTLAIGRLTLGGVPVAIVLANVLGSFLMGMLVSALALRDGGEGWRLFAAIGLLGGFTTFSSFSLEAVLLWQRGEPTAAIGYVAASVLLSLAGLVLGLAIGRLAF